MKKLKKVRITVESELHGKVVWNDVAEYELSATSPIVVDWRKQPEPPLVVISFRGFATEIKTKVRKTKK